MSSLKSADYEKNAFGRSSDTLGRGRPSLADLIQDRKIWRKLDLCILPTVAMFYLLSFLDRTNFANARVAGLQKELKMTDKQYSIALTVTYIPYIIAELPSNLLLKAVGPNLMLPTMLTLWGVVTTSQGAVTSYTGLLIARFFLGLFEGGVFPGLVLYLSSFYPRQQLQWRVSAFFSTASLSGAFSGILAYGIINMNGMGGRPGWAWIFIVEGLFTVAFGIASFFLLPRSPAHARCLNEWEKDYVIAQLKDDGATGSTEEVDSFSWREVGQAFTLPQVWMVSIIFFLGGTVLYALAYFTPSIVQGLGYTAANAQLMSVPPFACAFVLTMSFAWVSDHFHCRGFVTMFSCSLCAFGFAMYYAASSNAVRYGSLFLSIPGVYCSAPALATWNSNNAAPHTRRATAIAIGFIMTNAGGILATWLLGSLSKGPLYTKATITLLIFSALMVPLAGANTYYLWSQNKKKSAIRNKMMRSSEKTGLGDRSAWFVYNL